MFGFDATAIVLFSIFLNLALMPGGKISWLDASGKFAMTFFGSALLGAIVGAVATRLIRISNEEFVRATLTLTAAYGSFLLAEAVMHVSGIMASLAAGLVIAHTMQCQSHASEESALN